MYGWFDVDDASDEIALTYTGYDSGGTARITLTTTWEVPMATLTTDVLTPVGKNTTGTAVGQASGWTAANGGGDKIPISGRGVILRMRTAGTAADVTLNSVLPSNYGTDVNPIASLSATDEQEVFIANDGRFDLGGADRGLVGLSYSSVTGLSIAAKVVPG